MLMWRVSKLGLQVAKCCLIGMLAGLEGAAKKMKGNTLEQGFGW
jgi:hypothetical protein